MTEEEYFIKNYPDSCYGDKPLSPHFDFFQDGVEFGERQSEKKIAELELENEKLKNRNAGLKGMYAHSAREAGTYKQFFEKERKENAELKSELTKKADTNHSLVEQMADLESENAELKAKNKWYSEQVCYKECAEVWGNLTKAEEIIKKLKALYLYPVVTKDDVKRQDEILNEAEQFLKEIEK